MDYQFTAQMEDELDSVAEGNMEWRPMLREFYSPFDQQAGNCARDRCRSVRQEETVGRDCPVIGSSTGHSLWTLWQIYRLLKLSRVPLYRTLVGTHREFHARYAVRQHGGEIVVRKSRKGRTFYGCSRYPECEFTSWKRPLPPPCPNCGNLLVEQNKTTAQCTVCEHTYPDGRTAVEM